MPLDVETEIRRLGGRRADYYLARFTEARDEYAAGRERAALRVLRQLRDTLPDAPSVRELTGLAEYSIGNYRAAAKELEAFQAMAAFFVHDLKNAASTLNLMLQNLPVHFDDPEFRADALRGIGKTVNHINRLIGRLGALRHELKIEGAAADLNEVVDHVLTGIERSSTYNLTKDLQPLPKLELDGPVEPLHSNFIWGPRRMPVRF